MHSFRFHVRTVIIVALLLFTAFGVGAQAISEDQVKAAFLYNFATFVEWPSDTFKSAGDPFVICVLGGNTFSRMVEDSARGKTIDTRPLAVTADPSGAALRSCQILFVRESARKQFRTMASAGLPSGILLVGEAADFIANGGVVRFKLEDGHIRFDINPQAAERERLRISSKLLTLAQITRR